MKWLFTSVSWHSLSLVLPRIAWLIASLWSLISFLALMNFNSSAFVSAVARARTRTEIFRAVPSRVQQPSATGMISISMLAPHNQFTTALRVSFPIAIWSSSFTLLTSRCPLSTITSRSSTMRMHLESFDTTISNLRTVAHQQRLVLKVR